MKVDNISTIDKFPPVTPHGNLEQVSENVFIVQGSFSFGPGVRIGRTMTIVRRGEDLTIFSSIRCTPSVEEEILKLGKIKHLVRLCISHGNDDPYYILKFEPTFWQQHNMKEHSHPGAPHDKTLSEDGTEGPIPSMKVIEIKTAKLGVECMVWIPDDNGTLITSDFLQNTLTSSPHMSFLGRAMFYSMGFYGECQCCPMYRHLTGNEHWPTAEKVLGLEFENLISAHGEPKIGGAKAAVEKNLNMVLQK